MSDKEASAFAFIEHIKSIGRRESLQYEGRKVCWRIFGGGPPLVLLHGGHGSWMHWIRTIETMSIGRTLLIPDMPGYGESDAAAVNGSLPAVVEPLIATLNQIVGAEGSIELAGFSFGGLVAAVIARQRGYLTKLALVGSTGHKTRRRPIGKLRDWRPAYRATDMDQVDLIMRHNLSVHMLSLHPDEIDPLAAYIHRVSCVNTRFRSKELSLAGGLIDALKCFDGQVMAVWGAHDVTVTTEEISLQLSNEFSTCGIQVIPNSGHWVQYQESVAVNSIFEKFFS